MEKFFKIDARALIALGRNSIKDHTTALIELVKNSYDADADLIQIGVYSKLGKDKNYISVADNGDGMTADEVEKQWLRIGFSEKRKNPATKKHRRKTGEKGIGRLSADRLGAQLELITKADNHEPFGLKINWDDFDLEGQDLSSIPVNTIDDVTINIPNNGKNKKITGTELIIKNLRQTWEEDDLKNLYEELSILTPPFEGFENDLKIVIKTDITEKYSGVITSSFTSTAEIELEVTFDDEGNLEYKIYERSLAKDNPSSNIVSKKLVEKNALTHGQFIQTVQKENDYKKVDQEKSKERNLNIHPKIGSFRVVLKFFPRKSSLLEGTKFSMTDLREFLDINSGVKIYRDRIRVKPYGNPDDPEGDWLGLSERKTRNPAGPARADFRVGLNQIVGAVFLSAETNPKLVDSSSREGLIHDDEYSELKRLLQGCIVLLESHYHSKFTKEKSAAPQSNVIENVRSLDSELKTLADGLSKIKEDIPKDSNRIVEKQLQKIDSVIASLKTTSKSIDELASQATIFRGLATLGIAATVFGHETQSSIAGVTSTIHTARRLLLKESIDLQSALEEIDKSTDFAEKVARWGSFALSRVVRDKRKKQKINISEVIQGVCDELLPAFEASNIEVLLEIQEVEGRVITMDIESVLINLLTNAYTACQQVQKNRKISLEVKMEKQEQQGFLITVSDSGPGVPEKYIERVWEPLFSTKMDKRGMQIGTGLGLMIVKSTVEELGGKISLQSNKLLGGAQFSVWIPI